MVYVLIFGYEYEGECSDSIEVFWSYAEAHSRGEELLLEKGDYFEIVEREVK